MTDPTVYLTLSLSALAGTAMMTTAGLAGWRGWLQLKRLELARDHDADRPAPTGAGARIEIADLRERIRKLEAIAAGVEL
ncbi:MAG: hypothetical protein JWN21_285 [Sphingomonas bacterium]|uniref:hypothetical protein n=1 Tax=Sphingomonas bacterium TaxID=1895847 RepID=UPI0026228C25|nr:hypothetical protein [Sphingomonas bacterium]MDB5694742.1 hypothetical protein [Sphingomonas bacterium]